jgi:hypothetical protein
MEKTTPTPHHKLIGKWDLYYHLPHDKNWDLSSYRVIANDIDSMERTIAINESIPENVVKFSMLFAMRSGITPQWEDPKNRTGGCFSFKVINKQVYEVWKALFYAMCGETICVNKQHSKLVNGITVSPKRSFCIVKIWLEKCSLQDPNVVIDIPNLQKQGCLFKKHAPEF